MKQLNNVFFIFVTITNQIRLLRLLLDIRFINNLNKKVQFILFLIQLYFLALIFITSFFFHKKETIGVTEREQTFLFLI